MEKPKKQFKSQSVNDLFRQQAASKAASSSLPGSAKLERSTSPGNTKLRLVAKKSRNSSSITLSKLKKPNPIVSSGPSKVTSETIPSESPSPLGSTLPIKNEDIEIDPIQKLPETIGKFINGNNNSNASESNNNSTNNSQGELQNNNNKPPKSRFNWDESPSHVQPDPSNNSLWNESTPPTYEERNNSNNNISSFHDISSWSPNSKISSFRKGTSLTQSPLNQQFFNDMTQRNSPFSSRQNSEIFTSLPSFSRTESAQQITENRQSSFGEFWKSPSIWNNQEERQLSTKSDSVLNWSPFDIDALSLDDSQLNYSSHDLRHQHSFDVGSSRSRFFPPSLEEQQLQQIPERLQHQQPQQPQFGGLPPMNRSISNTLGSPQQHRSHSQLSNFPIVPQLQQSFQSPIPQTVPRTPLQQPLPRQFFSPEINMSPVGVDISKPAPILQEQNQTQEEEPISPIPKELIVTSSDNDPLRTSTLNKDQIPISLPIRSNKSFISQERPHIKTLEYELPHYPEGFSSTFYKRGINNFMFIRELQPKIITSKYGDSVEMRLTFPAWDEDYKMKASRVDVDVKELDGKLGGLKVSKPVPVKKPFRGGFNRNLVYNKR